MSHPYGYVDSSLPMDKGCEHTCFPSKCSSKGVLRAKSLPSEAPSWEDQNLFEGKKPGLLEILLK